MTRTALWKAGFLLIATLPCALPVQLVAQEPRPGLKVAAQEEDEAAVLRRIAERGGVSQVDPAELAAARKLATNFSNDMTAAAWLELGNLYQKRGDQRQMVVCWQRAAVIPVSDPRIAFTWHAPQNHANEKLSEHYYRQGQWEEALRRHCDYRYSSSCLILEMLPLYDRRKLDLLVLTGRHALAVDLAWSIFARYGTGSEPVLTQLYAESGQLNDLRAQLREIGRISMRSHQAGVFAARGREEWIASLRLAASRELDDQLDAILFRLPGREVAAWRLAREEQDAVPRLIAFARGPLAYCQIYSQLIAMETPLARDALVELAVKSTDRQLREMRILLEGHPDCEAMLTRLSTAIPAERKPILTLDHNRGVARLAPLARPWPKPPAGSLPKTLSQDILADFERGGTRKPQAPEFVRPTPGEEGH